MRLKDKVVLITASTRGIGLAITKACAEEGAIVYMGARNLERAGQRADELNQKGFRVRYVYNDAYKTDTYVSMIEEVVQKEGRIDVLVNNFGTSDPKKDSDIGNTDYEDFLKIVNTNLTSVFVSSQAAVKHMESQGGGSIVNISSIGGLVPDISQIAYGTSKAAINYMTKLIAVQEARHNIRCNAVLPGMTATDAVQDHLSKEFKEFFLKHTPIRRMGEPKEVAAAVVYFASDESAYTTGQIMDISGGFGKATPIFGDMAEMKQNR